MELAIEQAFLEGDPQEAWKQTQNLVTLSKDLVRQAAEDRFKVNFGTSVCTHCEGLKAGPDVTATCFQIRQCYYDNVRQRVSPKKKRLIERLTKE